jgi:hypothetical protein
VKKFGGLGNYSELCKTIQSFTAHFRSFAILFRASIYYSFVNLSELCAYIQNYVKLFRAFEDLQRFFMLSEAHFNSEHQNCLEHCESIQNFVQIFVQQFKGLLQSYSELCTTIHALNNYSKLFTAI